MVGTDDQSPAPRRRRRLRGIVAATAVAAAVGVAVAAVVPAMAGTVPLTGARGMPKAGTVAWGACPEPMAGDTSRDPEQACGTLRVPLDYRSPQGRTIEIAVSRLAAANPQRRLGVLLVDGGGPGPNLDMPSILKHYLPADIVERYDLVGFDPRGISHSTPMTCGRSTDDLVRDEQRQVLSFPAADGSISRNVEFSRQLAKDCAAASGDLLPYLTTVNMARDMNQLRQALGERTVSYFGLSWGTYLGSVYRALFPATVDRMVLDSSVDPNERGYDDFRTFSGATEDRWPDLARFAVANQDVVKLGGTEAEVRANYLATTAKLDSHPVTLAGTKATLDGSLVRLFTFEYSYSDAAMMAAPGAPAPLAQLWRAAVDFANGEATSEDQAVIENLANGFAAQGALPGIPQDNLYTVGYANSCADQAWPHDVKLYARNTAADRARYPLTAGAPANVTPCSFWQYRPIEPQAKVTSTGTRNVLILQNRRDPATPLRSAEGMRRALGGDASLVVVDAGGHGVLIHPKPSACAIGTMVSFLTTGALPAGDPKCAAQE